MKENKLYCDTSKLSIRIITNSVAKELIVNTHYSGKWTKVSYSLGLFTSEVEEHPFFDGVKDKLIGVACYGDPIGRLTGQSVSPLLDRTSVLELTRLFVYDGYGSNIESWFISKTFNWLRTNVPTIKALISYSDPTKGHYGTIYQATNWIYQGNKIRFSNSWSFQWENGGEWFHQRNAYVKFGTTHPNKVQKLSKSTFWIKREMRKHRYIYILSKKGELRRITNSIKHPSLPYPTEIEEFVEDIRRIEPISLDISN